MALVEEPILSRLDRIDFMVRKLEEMKGSSSPSTPSSGRTQTSSLDLSSPRRRSIGKHQCRSMEQVMEEAERKGTLLERLYNVEEQVLKLCSHYEEEIKEDKEKKTKKKKKGLRKLVDKVVGPSSSPSNSHSKSWRC
ncbi:hypothetical protein Rs2_22242 [Raphanus sativus]|uniref:Uncharacterized protein LOC108856369 n=1 Tax=Raphanus sativus TaxID=3726 RepID=A0A6J0NLX7_RAPSA|nr:uncharacterized protein LOC108856369 [Raphanus sativus]KAJ4895448.1 hypothetical protein Rs2_22242 [Raphanus sativus]